MVINCHIPLNLFEKTLLASLIPLFKFLEHLVLNLGESDSDIHLTTSLRLFWNHS